MCSNAAKLHQKYDLTRSMLISFKCHNLVHVKEKMYFQKFLSFLITGMTSLSAAPILGIVSAPLKSFQKCVKFNFEEIEMRCR